MGGQLRWTTPNEALAKVHRYITPLALQALPSLKPLIRGDSNTYSNPPFREVDAKQTQGVKYKANKQEGCLEKLSYTRLMQSVQNSKGCHLSEQSEERFQM